MVNDDLVKCPFCGGFTHVVQPDLLAALRDSNTRQQIEACAAQLLRNESPELAAVEAGREGTGKEGRDFNKDVHAWNPFVPVWRRSPKE